ncbi:MAG: undecaprenyldiphospho-muramoylpentapeptide beta-N-acetylglucosaminyltransferase [bacterium]
MGLMRLIIAGGGSGGHFFPAIAIINEILKRNKGIEYMYVGSETGIEAKKWTLPVEHRRLLDVRGFKNKTFREQVNAIILLFNAMTESRNIINEFKPDIVLGVGGYASFPIVMTAAMMHIPCAIHEQNSVPGLANKLLSRFVKKVFISFEASMKYLPQNKVILTGLPIRYTPMKSKKLYSGTKTVLILGGSQGAHQINKMMIDALKDMQDLKDKIKLIHQTGASEKADVEQAYKRYGFNAQVFDFIDDMEGVFEKADLCVSRAGASTLFELAAYGIPSILIPYPSATSDHQAINANEVARYGGAIIIPAMTREPDLLIKILHELINDTNRLERMSEAMLKWAKPNASARIVDELSALAGEV